MTVHSPMQNTHEHAASTAYGLLMTHAMCASCQCDYAAHHIPVCSTRHVHMGAGNKPRASSPSHSRTSPCRHVCAGVLPVLEEVPGTYKRAETSGAFLPVRARTGGDAMTSSVPPDHSMRA